jgi:hypothetical protein
MMITPKCLQLADAVADLLNVPAAQAAHQLRDQLPTSQSSTKLLYILLLLPAICSLLNKSIKHRGTSLTAATI